MGEEEEEDKRLGWGWGREREEMGAHGQEFSGLHHKSWTHVALIVASQIWTPQSLNIADTNHSSTF